MGKESDAGSYITKMLTILEKFIDADKQTPTSVFVTEPYPDHHTSPYKNCIKLLRNILDKAAFSEHRDEFLIILRLLEEKAHEKMEI